MKKLIFSFLIFLMGACVFASSDSMIGHAVKKSEISKTALIGVSFKEVNSSKTVVDYNSRAPMSVASVQKIVTTIPAVNTLGLDYEFTTQILKNNKDLYVKLGADPYLTSKTLKNLIKELGKYKIDTLNAIYIDDSIVDRIEWGEGWQWDNTLNSYMPKFGAYNIDSNLLTVVVKSTSFNAPAEIFTMPFYPITFKNNVVTSTSNNVSLFSRDYVEPDYIEVFGTVLDKQEMVIPINDLRKYFILRLKDSLKSSKIGYYGKFKKGKSPNEAILVSEYKTPVKRAIADILQYSNNTASETLFKLAGGKYAKSTGTVEHSVDMFKEYYKAENIDTDGIKITDASGVSKNNLLTADFITNVLVNDYNKENAIKQYMAVPGIGTLSNRMLYFKDRLIAKTGTLQNVSSIAGYLTAQSGKVYAFCIIVNDPKSKNFEKKAFEEYLLRTAYEGL